MRRPDATAVIFAVYVVVIAVFTVALAIAGASW